MKPEKSFFDWLQTKAKELTPTERRLANHLIEHHERWAFDSAAKLADQLHVHRSTIVRFANKLGFSGFPQLQRVLRDHLLHFFVPSRELSMDPGNPTLGHLFQAVYEREQQNLTMTYRNLDAEVVEEAAGLLARARKVVVFGRRFSYAIACHLSLSLRTMRDQVRLSPEPGGSAVDTFFDLDCNDAALIVSLRRTSPEVQRAMEYLIRAGVPLILLTDVSPAAEVPEKTRIIRAYVGSTSLLDSYTAMVSVCHLLLALISHHLPHAVERVEAIEHTFHRYYKHR